MVRKHNYADRGGGPRDAYPMAARIRAEAASTRVDIFDDIGSGGWSGGLSAADFAGQLAGVTGPLTVAINSAGGDVFDGLAMYNAISSYAGGPVTTQVDGIAASIASVIFQAGRARVMSPGSMAMVHDAFGMAVGNAAEMAKMAQTLDQVSGNLAGVYAARCGGTAQHWRQAMRAETWYTADEAVAAGLADRVGAGAAVLPAGLDLAAYSAVPARIAARLRSMPRAAAPPGDDGGSCQTCGGWGRLKHPGTGNAGVKCPGCDGTGTYDPDGAQDRLSQVRAALKP